MEIDPPPRVREALAGERPRLLARSRHRMRRRDTLVLLVLAVLLAGATFLFHGALAAAETVTFESEGERRLLTPEERDVLGRVVLGAGSALSLAIAGLAAYGRLAKGPWAAVLDKGLLVVDRRRQTFHLWMDVLEVRVERDAVILTLPPGSGEPERREERLDAIPDAEGFAHACRRRLPARRA